MYGYGGGYCDPCSFSYGVPPRPFYPAPAPAYGAHSGLGIGIALVVILFILIILLGFGAYRSGYIR
ncbi:sporulation protein YjcZ [Evansella sp. AB-P1]|uniref:sporulation protein YjcZ n=1 Tax=Evansella sp. AB-P1 TaxID=3037653 RepID=UPI00241CD1C5|nr:sporulation protein YjcZ [Evansella sp. AB-P1]MDG5789489.1 sporulation protein YjcZ [Evansella sp. AB-P1]